MNTSPALPLQNDVTDLDAEPNLSGLHLENSLASRTKSWFTRYDGEYFGYMLLVGSQLFNSLMITSCKLLVTDAEFETKIHPLQILFVRMTITYACCLMYMGITRSVPHAPFGEPSVRKWLVLRGVVGFVGVFGLYFSLRYLSVSDAVAITFLVPLFTAFLAWVLIHERYSLLEGFCSLISLGGVLLIAKPHFLFGKEADNESNVDDSIESSSTEKRLLASGVGLLGAMGASAVFIILRKIGNRAHPLLSVSYFALATIIVSGICIVILPSVSFAVPQNGHQWFLFFVIGVSGFFFQFALTAGIQRVKAGKASLVVYTQMVFAIGWDLLIWHHLPGLLSVLGIIIIIACTLVVIKSKSGDEEGDIEQGHRPLPQDEDEEDKPEDIALQDFVITDDEDEDPFSSNRPPVENVENELNSMKYSKNIKLNAA